MRASSRARLAFIIAFAACAPSRTVQPTQPAPKDTLPTAIKWSQNSAEHRAIFLQTFRLAGERLAELARSHATGTWAVIMDGDETVLDGSESEADRARRGVAFSDTAWARYVTTSTIPPTPGAIAFVNRIHELGGRAIIVTNRSPELCAATIANYQRIALSADAVLCQTDASHDKNPRFRAVAAGTAQAGLPALEVLMYVGDNIQDFPGLTQSIRTLPDSAFAHFGRDYFMLPNPMYGSWERN